MRRLTTFALVALAICGIGCGPAQEPASPSEGAAPETVRVAFVTNNASDFWTIAREGTKKAAEDLKCAVEFRIPPTGAVEEQQRILEDLVVGGIDGIAISPIVPANQTAMLNAAAAKAPLVTQDSDAPQSDRVCYIGTDNVAAGRAAGELVKEALPEGGKIMVFVGTLDAQNAQDRLAGLKEVVEPAGIVVVDVRTDETDRLKAVANVEDTLVGYSDIGCLVGLWSYNGPAILKGVTDSGKLGQIQIVTFDEEPETLEGVKAGHILGTIVQQPYEFGYQSVRLLLELAGGNDSRVPENKQIFIPVKTITPHNVDAFRSELEALKGAA